MHQDRGRLETASLVKAQQPRAQLSVSYPPAERFNAEHPYGPNCYAAGGCADIIEGFAERIDAREFNPAFPATFPRYVQHAIWLWCAEWGWNLCNGRKIDDTGRCQQIYCPAHSGCDRIALYGLV
ncbi:hypothetical protein [Methylobacterium sp. WL19]|uniref:hypothetical protein n=1 Tax=Methylobacterium sp. WL19 TaxID=2603896 RepID=UPI00164F3B75|nr:hypothetical protein [Methylobacterium sp. WL19]